jgi:hypothetical protein
MRLSFILEARYSKALKNIFPLLKVMPQYKITHSINVGKNLSRSDVGEVGLYAGFLHDYLERGGTAEELSNHIDELGLPPEIIRIVTSLSSDEKNTSEEVYNEPLQHLKRVIAKLEDQEIIDLIVLIKLSDRIDNLTRKLGDGRISKKYIKKSLEIYRYVRSIYKGETKPFELLCRQFERRLNSAKIAVGLSDEIYFNPETNREKKKKKKKK